MTVFFLDCYHSIWQPLNVPNPATERNRGYTIQRLPTQPMHLKYMQGTQNAACMCWRIKAVMLHALAA